MLLEDAKEWEEEQVPRKRKGKGKKKFYRKPPHWEAAKKAGFQNFPVSPGYEGPELFCALVSGNPVLLRCHTDADFFHSVVISLSQEHRNHQKNLNSFVFPMALFVQRAVETWSPHTVDAWRLGNIGWPTTLAFLWPSSPHENVQWVTWLDEEET